MESTYNMNEKTIDIETNRIAAPFKVPSNYFEDFEENLLFEIKLRDTFCQKSTEVPKRYFADLENQILAKTIGEVHKISLWKKYRNHFATAAAIAIVSLMGYYSPKSNIEPNIDQLSNNEIIAYLETQKLTESDLAALVDTKKLGTLNLLPNKIELSDQEIEEMILEI